MPLPKLPRLLADPASGETVLEFSQLDGEHVSALDRRVIMGLFEGELEGETIKQQKKGVGILRVVNGLYVTSHTYSELRDLLWPVEKDGVF